MAQRKGKYLRRLKPHFEYVSEAWEEFFFFAEKAGTIAELGLIWITSPFWIIPYLIYKKHKGEALDLMKKYIKCPQCGCETVGAGTGTIEIDTAAGHFIRTCHCGWKVEIQEDTNDKN